VQLRQLIAVRPFQQKMARYCDNVSESSRALRLWFCWGVISLSLLGGCWLLLWYKLPHWAPAFVIEHSPWIEPAIRAQVAGDFHPNTLESYFKRWESNAAPDLIALMRDDDEKIRQSACHALYFCKSIPHELFPQLVALRDSIDPKIRHHTMIHIGFMKHSQSLPFILDQLSPEDDLYDESENYGLSNALSHAWDKRGVEPVLQLLKGDIKQQEIAFIIFSMVKEPQFIEPIIAAVSALNEDLPHSQFMKFIQHGAEGLGNGGLSTQRCITLLESDQSPLILLGLTALMSTRAFEYEIDLSVIQKCVTHPDENIRIYALLAMWRSGIDSSHIQIAHLSDPSESVRNAAINYFSIRKKDPRSVPPLISLLDTDTPSIKRSAINALVNQNDVRGLQPIIDHLDHEDSSVRLNAYPALNKIIFLDFDHYGYSALYRLENPTISLKNREMQNRYHYADRIKEKLSPSQRQGYESFILKQKIK
jgi:hypothetical protein